MALRVLAGLSWPDHVTFLDERRRARAHRAHRARGRPPVCLASSAAGPGHRQRDPGADRALARRPRDRAPPAQPVRSRQGSRPRRPRHLRELPDDRVSRAAVPRFRLLQRLSGIARPARRLPRAPAQHRRRPPAAPGRGRPRQPAPRRDGSGATAWRLSSPPPSRAVWPARSSSRGPTSGTAAAWTSRTGTSASPGAIARPSPRSPRSGTRWPSCRARRIASGP